MGEVNFLPFKVGEVAESRSFQIGFRSAWFRCKIKEISQRKGHISHALEFFDFPDEKVKCTKLYQLPPVKSRDVKRQLMVRPKYPPLYHESQMPHVSAISEVIVIVDGVWKVGDLVDWWSDGCYWSGRVSEILGNDKIQIELPVPPVGEGESYEAFFKDLRPSLDWSPEHGWSVPMPMVGKNCRRCAWLIQPINQAAGAIPKFENHAVDEGIKGVQATAGTSFEASISSHISANSLPAPDESAHCRTVEISKQPLGITVSKETTHKPEAKRDLEMRDSVNGKTSGSDSVSSSHVRDSSAEIAGHTAGEEMYYSSGSLKKSRTGGSIPLNSKCQDTLEAAILDLEELANKVKWLKGILEFGIPLSNGVRPPWKFVEHRASSTPK